MVTSGLGRGPNIGEIIGNRKFGLGEGTMSMNHSRS